MTSLPQLYPAVPGAPRTETVVYHATARKPFVPPLPDLDLPPRERHDAMLDLAANALRFTADLRSLCGSEPHVRELCRVVERLDTHDAQQHERAAVADRQLSECRALLAEQQELRLAALADALQQRTLAVQLSEQLAARHRPVAAPQVVHVAELARLRGYSAPADWDSSDLPTVVGGPRYEDDADTVVVSMP